MVDSSIVNNWLNELLDDNNFEQKKPFDYELCVSMFEECAKNTDKLNPYLLLRPIWEITKAFSALSSALSVGFSDITSKVNVWRNNIKNYYKNSNTIQDVIVAEMNKNLEKLNGDNNSKLGHKKKTEFYEYVSCSRTIVRLQWFLDFFNNIIIIALENEKKGFNDCIRDSYDKVLAPHHPWLVRKGAGVGISMAPSKKEKAMKSILGEEKWDDDTKNKMKRWSSAILPNLAAIKSFLDTKNLQQLE